MGMNPTIYLVTEVEVATEVVAAKTTQETGLMDCLMVETRGSIEIDIM